MFSVLNFAILLIIGAPAAHAQQPPAGTFLLQKDSLAWLRLTGAVQVWTRYTDNNPGSALSSGATTYAQASTFDIGIRRARFQAFGPIAPRVFFYSQFGINNFTYHSPRKLGAFFHDLSAEYMLVKQKLHIGGGLTGWSGLARYASPAIASTLMHDAPLFQQATNDVNDQFLRKLTVFAKGTVKKLDYRVAIGKPMLIQQAIPAADTTLSEAYYNVAVFSPRPPRLQSQAYIFWQFLDVENSLLPYTNGSYLGTRRIFNIGGGVIWQPDAVRYRDERATLVHSAMTLGGIDVFFDYALDREAQTALTVYGGIFGFDYGPNFIKPLGVMNTVNAGTIAGIGKFSGFGNAFPMNGTGNVGYIQAGYLFRRGLLRSFGTLQPYADLFYARYHALLDPVIVWNAGINWLVSSNNGKISLNYQDRPVFRQAAGSYEGTLLPHARRGMVVLQLQAFF